MKVKEVHILMEKYFDGKTSLEEEKRLRDFFSNSAGELPNDLSAYKALFNRNYKNEGMILDEAFTANIWDEIVQNEPKTKVVSFNAVRWFFAAAASFILMLSVYQWYGIKQYEQFMAMHNEQEMTKEEALVATKQALAFVSLKLNEGCRPIKNVGSFYRFQNVIKKSKNEVISKDIIN